MIQRFAVLFLLGVATMPAQQESSVVGVGTFLHIVSDLDQSLAFYHDTLGLELRGPAGEHKFTDNPAVANLYGVPGKQFRAAVLKIPGSEMGIELVQWGEARKPNQKRISDLGTVRLLLHAPTATPKAIRHDPDGFPVELEQSDGPGADLSVSVADVNATKGLYTKALGFEADGEWLVVPRAFERIRFTQAKNTGRLNVPFPEAGQGMLRLIVRNAAGHAESLKAAGFSVITTGGVPVTLPQGPRVIILRDPNNFYLQLMETR